MFYWNIIIFSLKQLLTVYLLNPSTITSDVHLNILSSEEQICTVPSHSNSSSKATNSQLKTSKVTKSAWIQSHFLSLSVLLTSSQTQKHFSVNVIA